MPALRRKQSNAMLYTLIIFVGLFIIATTIAVFYYIKAEEHRIGHDQLQTDFEKYVSNDEKENVGSIIGQQGDVSTTYLGTMVEYLDKAISLIAGGVPQSTSAEVKINTVRTQSLDMLAKAKPYIGEKDPNLTGLTQVVTELAKMLQDTIDSKNSAQKSLANNELKLKDIQASYEEKYQTLQDEKEMLRDDYNDIKIRYQELSDLLKQTTDKQVQTLKDQIDREQAEYKKLNDKLLETQAVLLETQSMLAVAKEELAGFGVPKNDSMAFKADGSILSIDNNAKIAYINLGSNDHVYRGLTFAIYDKGAYIGEKGQEKAEIEIFDIGDTYSAARIIKSQLNRPILKGDTAANLIWDKQKTNEFVIAGNFDLDGDGKIDSDAETKIKATIEKWGGKVTNKISIETDYLILGTQPQVLEKPTDEEQAIDPTSLQRYQSDLEKVTRYNELADRAKALWIPIFTYEKFVHLIGYSEKMGQAGAF